MRRTTPRIAATDAETGADAPGWSAVNAAVLFGLGTMIAWGFWIVFGNVASNTIDPETAAFVSYLTATVITGVYVVFSDASLAVTNRGLLFAGAAGVAAAIGVVSTFVGVTVGPTSIVATIGGMYFVTAAVISIVAFGEPVTATKVAGITLALTAIVLINQ
jgi:uncharacterized membrane protein